VSSDVSINHALGCDCEPVRLSYTCPNKKKCKNFFDRDTGYLIVKRLRKDLWDPGQSKDRGLKLRRDRLKQRLSDLSVVSEDGSVEIVYKLNDVNVCKSFYKVQ